MRTLIGWDDPAEAETMDLVLNADDVEATVTMDGAEFTKLAFGKDFDVLFMSLNFPSMDEAFDVFQEITRRKPNLPIVGAWHQGEIPHLAKFISAGLQSNITRDENGEFIFLLIPLLEAAQAAAAAQRSRILAERLREEVDSVRRLQSSIIPRDIPASEGYEIAARYEPSQIRVIGEMPVVMAGGDYYDAFSIDENNMILLVGDASGHGVKACMSIMTMHTLIRMIRDRRYPSTVDFVTEVNRQLCESDIVRDEGGFITLLYSTLDVANHTIKWTSAGQPMPLLQNLETNEVTQTGSEEEGGLPLGIDEDWEYEQCSLVIPNNSRLLLFTDGLDEAFPEGGDEAEDQFGIGGIINCLKESVEMPIDDALDKLFKDSHAHTQGSGRADDTSVVLLERRDGQ